MGRELPVAEIEEQKLPQGIKELMKDMVRKIFYGAMPDDYGDWEDLGNEHPLMHIAIMDTAKAILSDPNIVEIDPDVELPPNPING